MRMHLRDAGSQELTLSLLVSRWGGGGGVEDLSGRALHVTNTKAYMQPNCRTCANSRIYI